MRPTVCLSPAGRSEPVVLGFVSVFLVVGSKQFSGAYERPGNVCGHMGFLSTQVPVLWPSQVSPG